MNREWTEEELEILRRDREAKIPVPVTAAKLGRPVPATYLRARRIGSLVQTHQAWDADSVARLRALVFADPPMTDKEIAAALERTVTQIRWKMKDLNLTGVRDLSKLAKATAARTTGTAPRIRAEAPARPVAPPAPPKRILPSLPRLSSPPAAKPPRPEPHPAPAPAATRARATAPSPKPAPAASLYTPLELAIKRLEGQLSLRLREMVAETEAGLVRAAKAAIVEKTRIDRRLSDLKRYPAKTGKAVAAKAPGQPAAKPERGMAARPVPTPAPKVLPAQEPVRPARKAAVRTVMPAAPVRPTTSAFPPAPPSPPPAPKIVVVETPAAASAPVADAGPTPTSGRGGWKAVRRDPARVAAQAKAKATKRADAVDLAQAAQAAIERFIAERGVTRTTADGSQALVSRLQARGYIVVRDEKGWTIDQRHRLASEAELVAFAEARGISLDAAA